MFHLRERSLPWNDKVNAGAKLPKCTACPESRDQPDNEHSVLAVRAL